MSHPPTKPHPMQPIVLDQHGVARFQENPIVRHLLDHGGIDLNKIALLRFSDADQEHFAQLVGFFVSEWGDLDYVSEEAIEIADDEVDRMIAERDGEADQDEGDDEDQDAAERELQMAIEHLRMSELSARALGCERVAVTASELALLLADYDRRRES